MKTHFVIIFTALMALFGLSSCHPIEEVEPEEKVGMEDGLVYISKSYAGAASRKQSLSPLFPQMATMKVTTTSGGRKNISLHYEFRPLDIGEYTKGGNPSMDLDLVNLQYKDTTGYFILSEKNISTELRLGCFEEPLPYENVSVEGTVGIDDYKRGTELLISGEIEGSPFSLRISTVTPDLEKSGLPDTTKYIGTWLYYYGVSLRNVTSSDIELNLEKLYPEDTEAEDIWATIGPGEAFYIEDYIFFWDHYAGISLTSADGRNTFIPLDPVIKHHVIIHYYFSGLEVEKSDYYRIVSFPEGCVGPIYTPIDNYTITDELFRMD